MTQKVLSETDKEELFKLHEWQRELMERFKSGGVVFLPPRRPSSVFSGKEKAAFMFTPPSPLPNKVMVIARSKHRSQHEHSPYKFELPIIIVDEVIPQKK